MNAALYLEPWIVLVQEVLQSCVCVEQPWRGHVIKFLHAVKFHRLQRRICLKVCRRFGFSVDQLLYDLETPVRACSANQCNGCYYWFVRLDSILIDAVAKRAFSQYTKILGSKIKFSIKWDFRENSVWWKEGRVIETRHITVTEGRVFFMRTLAILVLTFLFSANLSNLSPLIHRIDVQNNML